MLGGALNNLGWADCMNNQRGKRLEDRKAQFKVFWENFQGKKRTVDVCELYELDPALGILKRMKKKFKFHQLFFGCLFIHLIISLFTTFQVGISLCKPYSKQTCSVLTLLKQFLNLSRKSRK